MPDVTLLDETVYRGLGWPVLIQGDQLVLPLGRSATAVAIPMALAEAIDPILTARDRPAPSLTHPDAPGCRVFIVGEPFGALLPWPGTVQVISGMLALRPSGTPHGPVRWYRQAPAQRLTNCREIDLFAAVRTAGETG